MAGRTSDLPELTSLFLDLVRICRDLQIEVQTYEFALADVIQGRSLQQAQKWNARKKHARKRVEMVVRAQYQDLEEALSSGDNPLPALRQFVEMIKPEK